MLQAKCETCGTTGPLGTYFRVSGSLSCTERLLCAKCAETASSPGEEMRVQPAIDKTICVKCGFDNGSAELARIGELPFCPACREKLYQVPLPNWLKLSTAATLILLALALVHGWRYFGVEKELIRGERLVKGREYAGAVPLLKRVATMAPNCERCLLLLAKAQFLSGDFREGYLTLNNHNGGRFESSDLTNEVQGIFRRVDDALGKLLKAQEAAKANKLDEAEKLSADAAREYPESQLLADVAENMAVGAAFDHKDYERFAKLAETSWTKHQDSSLHAAGLASALACQYAVSGNPEFRDRAEQLLVKGKDLARSPDEIKAFQDYEARVRYRLETRIIIDPDEYNRRFGKQD